jgi:hypothetical protein
MSERWRDIHLEVRCWPSQLGGTRGFKMRGLLLVLVVAFLTLSGARCRPKPGRARALCVHTRAARFGA